MKTTTRISKKVKEQLDKMKLFDRESYNQVIENMIEDSLELNEKTRKGIDKARKEEIISHGEVKKRIGL